MRNRRTRYIVDGNLQWRLTRRAIGTWLCGGLMIFAFPVAISFLYGVFVAGQSPGAVVQGLCAALWFPFFLALMVVPIGIRDSFRFSNRIAGPMMRMKRNMTDLAAGHPIHPINLRPGDFFTDVVDQFNQLTENYQKLQQQVAAIRTGQPAAAPPAAAPLFPTVGGWSVDSQTSQGA